MTDKVNTGKKLKDPHELKAFMGDREWTGQELAARFFVTTQRIAAILSDDIEAGFVVGDSVRNLRTFRVVSMEVAPARECKKRALPKDPTKSPWFKRLQKVLKMFKGKTFTTRMIKDATGWSKTQVRQIVDNALEFGLIKQMQQKFGRCLQFQAGVV